MWTASGRPRLGDFAYRSAASSSVGAAGAAIIRWQRKRRCVPEDAYIRRGESEPMRRVTGVILFAVFALTFTLPAAAQPTPRRLAFAEVASPALQNNLQLRVALLDVAVAEAQLAQARGAKNPQVSVSGSYTRSQEQAGQTLTFPNPFGPTPPEITVTLTPPDPNMLAVRLGVEYPLYTGGGGGGPTAPAGGRPPGRGSGPVRPPSSTCCRRTSRWREPGRDSSARRPPRRVRRRN